MEQMTFRSLCYFISRCSAVLLLPDATPERFRSRDINLRIALHAGPGYWCFDPILERMTYVGRHVSRAARMEPITPPGEIYVSETLAALAAAEGATDLTCQYARQTPQAKG